MSSERDQQIAAFLARAGCGGAPLSPLPQDASTRAYARLTGPEGRPIILMDQRPSPDGGPCDPRWTESQRAAAGWFASARLSAGRVEAFAAVAATLADLGLSAPEIYAVDRDKGLMLLEDLGDAVFARVLEAGEAPEPLYAAAIDVLLRLHEAPPRAVLTGPAGDWPLLPYDDFALRSGARLFIDWLPQLTPDLRIDAAARAAFEAAITPLLAHLATEDRVLAHRDYHAENLIWRPERNGAARVGLLDFQDAVAAPPVWDLLSLLQDARRDVPDALEAEMLARYLAARPGLDRDAFFDAYASLATLNALRILGVFARLIVRDGKTRYRAFMPRMWGYLRKNLAQLQGSDIAALIAPWIPDERAP